MPILHTESIHNRQLHLGFVQDLNGLRVYNRLDGRSETRNFFPSLNFAPMTIRVMVVEFVRWLANLCDGWRICVMGSEFVSVHGRRICVMGGEFV